MLMKAKLFCVNGYFKKGVSSRGVVVAGYYTPVTAFLNLKSLRKYRGELIVVLKSLSR